VQNKKDINTDDFLASLEYDFFRIQLKYCYVAVSMTQ